jgi:flagellar biosynthetic protein FliP
MGRRSRVVTALLGGLLVLAMPRGARSQDTRSADREPPAHPLAIAERFEADNPPALGVNQAVDATPGALVAPETVIRSVGTVAVFAVASLVPVALMVLTAFVRISVVLALTRQALGSPQIPGTQVLTALALLLTALVMWPTGQRVYDDAVAPYAEHRLDAADAWRAGTEPIKTFMIEQIVKTKHVDYLWTLYDHAAPDRVEPTAYEDFPLRVVAPAFLLSELTTALIMGFAIYLPFLVIDLVVSAVLSAMGLFLLPPALVALPIKLGLFVLADGWMLVADMLVRSFASGSS